MASAPERPPGALIPHKQWGTWGAGLAHGGVLPSWSPSSSFPATPPTPPPLSLRQRRRQSHWEPGVPPWAAEGALTRPRPRRGPSGLVSGLSPGAWREDAVAPGPLGPLWPRPQAASPARAFLPSRVTSLFKGGDAKLLVIVCVAPGREHVAETLQSLGFGARARQVERQGGRGRPAPRGPREERGCLWAASPPPVSCHDGTCDVHT